MEARKQFRIGPFISLFFVLLAAFAYFRLEDIYDAVRLYNYTPPAAIVAIADEARFSEKGRKLFYVNHPQLQDKATFNQSCTDSEATIVLGCYISHKGIYLYDIDDKRLEGVEEVTAAHEMLHAAYDRLGSSEQRRIDALTQAAFEQVTSERIKNNVEEYRKKDPSVVPNELHSIIATEVRDLDPALEEYYKRYFTDRSVVVGLSEKYENEFASRDEQREEYDAQLESLKQQIDSLNADLNASEQQLQQNYRDLQRLRSSNPEAYNARVPGYNQQVNSYNRKVGTVQRLISEYNDIVEKRNALVLEEGELLEAIDSRPEAIESQ